MMDRDKSSTEEMCRQMVDYLVDKAIADLGHECPMCLEEMLPDRHTVLPCHHRFHNECIGSWMLKKFTETCPVCRKRMPPKVRSSLRKAGIPPPKKPRK